MKSLKNFLDKFLISTSACLFILMTVVGTYQILTRYLFNKPSTVSEEIISFAFAWMSMFAASYVFGKRDHMRMVFFIERFSEKTQNIVAFISEIVVLLFSIGILMYGGFKIVMLTMSQTTPALQIPMGFAYSVIPISGVFVSIYNVINLFEILDKIKGGK